MNSQLGKFVFVCKESTIKYGKIVEEHLNNNGWMYYKVDWTNEKDEALHRRDHVNIFNPTKHLEQLQVLLASSRGYHV